MDVLQQLPQIEAMCECLYNAQVIYAFNSEIQKYVYHKDINSKA